MKRADRRFPLNSPGSVQSLCVPGLMAVKRMEEEGVGAYLDAMVCVVDCVNFAGYEDTSYTAKLQARYTDLVLLNKWEHVRRLPCAL